MKKSLFTLIALAILAACASPATAQVLPKKHASAGDHWDVPYGSTDLCGNGEINVAVAYSPMKIAHGGPFYNFAPGSTVLSSSNQAEWDYGKPYEDIKPTPPDKPPFGLIRQGYQPLHSISYSSGAYFQAEHWPYLDSTLLENSRGEMCDGQKYTVLCIPPKDKSNNAVSARCTLTNSVDDLNTLGLDYSDLGLDKACYTAGKCGKAVGNGIIQPTSSEECDDGNLIEHDGCSPLGKIEAVVDRPGTRCGNGVIESSKSEDCDDGNNRNGDGCSSDCKVESSTGSINCVNHKALCGDGRVQSEFGEECDDGDKNGQSSRCSGECLLNRNPRFDDKRIAYWDRVPANVLLDAKYDAATPATNKPTHAQSNVKIGPNGKIISIEKKPAIQYSGVFLSGQHISDLSNKEIYPNGKIKLSAVISPTKSNDKWDDDALGIVIGMKYESSQTSLDKGNQNNVASSLTDYKYLMLSWRSYPPNEWGSEVYAYSNEKGLKACDEKGKASSSDINAVAPAQPGLRLYQISGAPDYFELWGMRSCNDKIKEINTYDSRGVNDFVNPFINLSTTYAFDFGYGDAGEDQRLQIDLEFSQTELTVMVNRQPALHIIKEKLEKEGFVWPTDGEMGFYLLGMDNITADFRGYSPRTENNAVTAAGETKTPGQETTRCEYCGDGIKASGEMCDDGNLVDGDGCDSDCKLSKETEICKTVTEAGVTDRLCFGGKIISPAKKASLDDSTFPEIKGSYVGPVDRVEIVVKSAAGTIMCKGLATLDSNKQRWEFDASKAGCGTLPDGQDYTAEATFVPIQSSLGNSFEKVVDEVEFSIDNTNPLTITIDTKSPENKIYVKDGDKLKDLEGACSSHGDTITLNVCEKGTNNCVTPPPPLTTKCNSSKKWNYKSIDISAVCGSGKKCVLTATIEGNGKSASTSIDVDVVAADNSADVKISSPKSNSGIRSGPGQVVTVEGQVTNSKCGDSCPPRYVTVHYECGLNKPDPKSYVTVKVAKDGRYRAVIPINCLGQSDGAFVAVGYNDINGKLEEFGQSKAIEVPVSSNDDKTIVEIECPPNGEEYTSCKVPEGAKEGGIWANGYISPLGQETVSVRFYKKNNKDEQCQFSDSQDKYYTTKVVSNLDGRWYVKLPVEEKDGQSDAGYYCVEASVSVGNYSSTKIVSTQVSITPPKKVVEGPGNDELSIPATGNVKEGMGCQVSVTDPSTTANYKDGTYEVKNGKLVCVVAGTNATQGQTIWVRNVGNATNPDTVAPDSQWKEITIDRSGGSTTPGQGGTNLRGKNSKKGKIAYDGNSNGDVAVIDLEGFSDGDQITLSGTKPDGTKVTDTCTVQQGKCEVTNANFNGVKEITATPVGDNEPVDTWFAIPKECKGQSSCSKLDKGTQPTITYVGSKGSSDKADNVIVTIPVKGAGEKLKEGSVVTVDYTDPQGQKAKVTCKIDAKKKDQNGNEYYTCVSDKAFCLSTTPDCQRVKDGEIVNFKDNATGDAIGTAVIFNLETSGSDPSVDPINGGLVLGGCGCAATDSPASSLLSLILAALGLIALRRRRED